MSIDKALDLCRSVDGCWIWPGDIDPKGYGRVFFRGKQRKAHRVAFELLKGAIPKGLEPDHLCRVRACFNPNHMEVVTHRVNSLRGDGVPAKNARKTHCTWGHPFDDTNSYVYVRPNGVAMRVCRACKLEETRRRRGKVAKVVAKHSIL
jgi:hypothetical protein